MNGFTDSRGFVWLIAGAGLGFGLLFIELGRRLWLSGQELRRAGVTHAARLEARERDATGRRVFRCRLEKPSGDITEVSVRVTPKVWSRMGAGDRVEVTLVPGRAETAKLGPAWAQWVGLGIAVALALVGLSAVVVFGSAPFRETTVLR